MRCHLPRPRWVVLAAFVIAGATVGGALAAFPDTDVETYTGCLNTGSSGGQISKVAVGNDPLKPCNENQKLVHLSGGDITNVVAGSGLTGGGDNGAVTLGLAAGHSLPQNCSSGQVPSSNGANAWSCADDGGREVWTSSGAVVIDEDETAINVVTLSLPAGSYLVHLTGSLADVFDGNIDVGCQLVKGPSQIDGGTAAANRDGNGRAISPLVGSTVVSSTEGFTLRVSCHSFEDTNAVRLRLTALRVGAVHDQSP